LPSASAAGAFFEAGRRQDRRPYKLVRKTFALGEEIRV
jgi:hypothetical protein